MKTPFSSMGSVALLCLFMSKASAADVFKPDSGGYIRDWVMLAPIALPEEGDCADLIHLPQRGTEKRNFSGVNGSGLAEFCGLILRMRL